VAHGPGEQAGGRGDDVKIAKCRLKRQSPACHSLPGALELHALSLSGSHLFPMEGLDLITSK
jgi:hypothetical protein